MTIFYRDETTGLEAGINNDGELFLGDNKSGYNLSDTPENREYIRRDFERYTQLVEREEFDNDTLE